MPKTKALFIKRLVHINFKDMKAIPKLGSRIKSHSKIGIDFYEM